MRRVRIGQAPVDRIQVKRAGGALLGGCKGA